MQEQETRADIKDKSRDPAWSWAAYEPDAQRPWSLSLAGHLYRRAGFGANWQQLQQSLADGPHRTIDKLLRPSADMDAFNRSYDNFESSAANSDSAVDLRAWWLRRMILTPHPLLEKMTLFWHNHFAVSNAVVHSSRLMQQHLKLLRSEGLGNYRSLLKSISLDPALLLWSGAAANRKAMPSELFARNFLEAYALGQGQFTDKDAREMARAFTGWFVVQGQLRYVEREHDETQKEILGKRGAFNQEQVVDLLLEQKAAPQLIVRKLYRWLISDTDEPDQGLLAPLAESFGKNYDVLALVSAMLRSNLFFSAAAYRRRIKNPVEFALGVVIGLEGLVSTSQLGHDLARMGQDLCHPPTPKGWTGGSYWINHATMTERHNFVKSLLLGSGPYGAGLRPWEVTTKYGQTTSEDARRFMVNLFLQNDLESNVNEAWLNALKSRINQKSVGQEMVNRRLAHATTMLPEFHLA